MIITNKRIITTRDQNDLETLKKFMESIFEQFNIDREKKRKVKLDDHIEEGGDYTFYRIPDGMTMELILSNGAELAPIEGDEMFELPGSVLTNYKYVFTPQEAEDNADQLSRSIREKREAESRKKEIVAIEDAKIKEYEARIQRLAAFVETKFDNREEDCTVVIDYTAKKRYYKSKTRKVVVKEEDLQNEDKQLLISFSTAPKK